MPFYNKEKRGGEASKRNLVNAVSEDAANKFAYVIP
jgi:hypothetical protein